jgi:MSHA biogenesis protein MshO
MNTPQHSFIIQKGFTMVELIMVIVIAGILAIGSVQFIGQATQGYSDAADRQQLATIGWIASEKMSRELRNALPNSLRMNAALNGTCIEFIPVISGSHYKTLPVLAAANNFEIIPMPSSYSRVDGERVAVYPTSDTDLYSQDVYSAVSKTTIKDIKSISGKDTYKLELNGNHQFLTDSPERRFFITQSPVMYCINGDRLNRYSNYGFSDSISSPSSPQIIVNNVQSGLFNIAPATLTRNAVVTLQFTLVNGATHSVDQEVQVRNVP